MDSELLKKAGLTGNEAKVYVELLKLGSVKAGEIIKKTDLHRQAVYDILERLMDKGLVSYVIKANRKYFEAANPKNLIDVIEKKEEELENDKKKIMGIIPELGAMRLLSKESQEVTLFKGIKGVQSLLDNYLSAKWICILGGYSEDAEGIQECLKYVLPRFHRLRAEKKIPMKAIFPDKSRVRADQLKWGKYSNVRILYGEFASLTGIQMCESFISIILWTKNPIAILIRSKEIASSYRAYFDYLWKQSKAA